MRTCMNDISIYAQAELKDIAVVTTQQIFEWYEDECMEIKQIQNQMMADAGFTTLTFKGKPLMWCPSAPAGNVYFINSNYLKFYCDPDYWMEMTDLTLSGQYKPFLINGDTLQADFDYAEAA